MNRKRLFTIFLLFAGATKIHGADVNYAVAVETSEPEEVLEFLPDVVKHIGPDKLPGTQDLDIEKLRKDLLNSLTPSDPMPKPLPKLPISKIKGRLLTPDEGCGFSKAANTKIVGGQNAKIGAWPWIALIGYRQKNSYIFDCGGTLITSRHVLTAAHCVNLNLVFVRLAEHDLTINSDGPHQDVIVSSVMTHNQFIPKDKINDIAVLYLQHDVDFTERVRPICLPIEGPIKDRSFIDTNPFIAGWGFLEENGNMSAILQQVQVPVQKNNVCKDGFLDAGELVSMKQFFEGVICAGDLRGGKDTCQGDSGGPLMLPIHENGRFPFYQIGVISYGVGCAQPNTPSIYTNIAYFSEWIKDALKF